MLTRPRPNFNTYHNDEPRLDPNKFNRPLKSIRQQEKLRPGNWVRVSASGANVLCALCWGLAAKSLLIYLKGIATTHITLVMPDLWQLVSIFKPASVTRTTNILAKTNELIFRPQNENEEDKTRT